MPRLTPHVMGVLVVLLAGCASEAIGEPTAPASVFVTSSPSHGPDSPSPSPSQAATPDSLQSPPTDITGSSKGPGKPGTMFKPNFSRLSDPLASVSTFRRGFSRRSDEPSWCSQNVT